MEMNKLAVGSLAFVGGLVIGRNWKKIAATTTGFYNKGVKKLSLKSAKKKTA